MTDQIAKFQIGLDFENKHLNVFKKINSFQGVLNKRTREAMGLGGTFSEPVGALGTFSKIT